MGLTRVSRLVHGEVQPHGPGLEPGARGQRPSGIHVARRLDAVFIRRVEVLRHRGEITATLAAGRLLFLRPFHRMWPLILECLCAFDEIGDLLTALAADALEVTRTVLRGDGLAALLADAAEERRTVLGRGARAALLADLLVELGTVLLADQAAAHAARLGHGHSSS